MKSNTKKWVNKCKFCEDTFERPLWRVKEKGPNGGLFCSTICRNGFRRAHKKDPSISNRLYTLRTKYGLTREDYELMVETQCNACAICERQFSDTLKPVVDHCHTTNKVRGLLCNNCNTVLGMAKDEAKVLSAAIDYLARSQMSEFWV